MARLAARTKITVVDRDEEGNIVQEQEHVAYRYLDDDSPVMDPEVIRKLEETYDDDNQ